MNRKAVSLVIIFVITFSIFLYVTSQTQQEVVTTEAVTIAQSPPENTAQIVSVPVPEFRAGATSQSDIDEQREAGRERNYLRSIAHLHLTGTLPGLPGERHPHYFLKNDVLEGYLANYDPVAAFILAMRVKDKSRRRELLLQSLAWSEHEMPGTLVVAARDIENGLHDPEAMTVGYIYMASARNMGYPLGDSPDIVIGSMRARLEGMNVNLDDVDKRIEILPKKIAAIRSRTIGTPQKESKSK